MAQIKNTNHWIFSSRTQEHNICKYISKFSITHPKPIKSFESRPKIPLIFQTTSKPKSHKTHNQKAKKKKKFETHEALPPTRPPPLSKPTTQHHHHLTHNPQPPQATTHNPTIIKSLSNPKAKKEKKKRKPMKQR